MAFLLFVIGFISFVLGLGYLFYPNFILRFYAFIRDNFLKDSIVILSHRRIGMILLLLSFILLAMTFIMHPQ